MVLATSHSKVNEDEKDIKVPKLGLVLPLVKRILVCKAICGLALCLNKGTLSGFACEPQIIHSLMGFFLLLSIL